MGKSRLNEVRACPIFFADTKEAISNFILRQPLFSYLPLPLLLCRPPEKQSRSQSILFYVFPIYYYSLMDRHIDKEFINKK